jgi:hypothetical protein
VRLPLQACLSEAVHCCYYACAFVLLRVARQVAHADDVWSRLHDCVGQVLASDLLQQAQGTPVASSMEALLQGRRSVVLKETVPGAFASIPFKDIELNTAGCNTLHERYASLVTLLLLLTCCIHYQYALHIGAVRLLMYCRCY